MPVGWGWRLTHPQLMAWVQKRRSGHNHTPPIWTSTLTCHRSYLRCVMVTVHPMPSNRLGKPRRGRKTFPAARFVRSGRNILREERRSMWLNVWCLRHWLPFLPLPRFSSRSTTRNPSGCSRANAMEQLLPTTLVCNGAGYTNTDQGARPFGVRESPYICPRPRKGLLPVFTPFDF